MGQNEQAPGVDTPRADKNNTDRTDKTHSNKIHSIRKHIKKLIVRYGWIALSLTCSPLNRFKLKEA